MRLRRLVPLLGLALLGAPAAARGERHITLRGHRLPRRFVLAVRWAGRHPVRRAIRLH